MSERFECFRWWSSSRDLDLSSLDTQGVSTFLSALSTFVPHRLTLPLDLRRAISSSG
eukprot:COSAG04_NODE_19174_length_422_cov_2.969040_2_plen_56_part_01